jgi:hypothetical protein
MSGPRRIDLNLATRPFENNFLPWTAYGLLALIVAGFTWYNVSAWMGVSSNLEEMNASFATEREEKGALQKAGDDYQKKIAATNLKDLRTRVLAANEVLAEREFSWTAMLNDLEQVLPYKVRLLELRPLVTAEGVLIEVRGVAKDLPNYWEFQQALQDHPKFRRIYPVGYSKGDPNSELTFALTFNYFAHPEDAPPDTQPALAPGDAAVALKAARHAPGESAAETGDASVKKPVASAAGSAEAAE